jgi:hypothetical protein
MRQRELLDETSLTSLTELYDVKGSRGLLGTPRHGHNLTSGHFGHFTANHHGAFMDQETHEMMVKHGDVYDTVLSPHQTTEIFLVLILIIVAAQVGLHWWKKNRRLFCVSSPCP